MDVKFSRLQNFVNESNNDSGQSWSRAIFSRDLFQTNINRVQTFFNKRTDASALPSSSNDDMQILLQTGDNDPILPALVRTSVPINGFRLNRSNERLIFHFARE